MTCMFTIPILLVTLLLSLAESASSQASPSLSNSPPTTPPPLLITNEILESLGYVKKNEFSTTTFKIAPRCKAPPFKDVFAVVDEKFTTISLDDYSGKWLILFFYPFDFTFVCPTELVSFSESIDTFRSLNTEVVAISTDSHHTHLAWIRTPREQGGLGKMNIPILADISKRIATNYGVLVTEEDDAMFGAALRGLFVIDPQSVVRSIQINDDAVGRSVSETLRVLKAFQFADSNPGQVCPANWKEGEATITADQDGKMGFFNNLYGSKSTSTKP